MPVLVPVPVPVPVRVRTGPPCGAADVRRTGRGRRGSRSGPVPGAAGTYTVRPAPAALTSRRTRPRRDAPQPRRYPGALRYRGRFATAGLSGTRSSPVPCRAAAAPVFRRAGLPGAAAAPVPRSPRGALGGRRRVGAGSARRLLLKPDPAPPSAPRSPRRPHPRPATGARGRARPRSSPGYGGAREQRRGEGGRCGAGGRAGAPGSQEDRKEVQKKGARMIKVHHLRCMEQFSFHFGKEANKGNEEEDNEIMNGLWGLILFSSVELILFTASSNIKAA
ncbi:translation initiation factor IF-2-like [Falco peregrinus]|uniref:translation initiation factor IF-2-like n=1 Tax=Falco peregrinus TaxID=8954 RepID=UPI00247AA256|nr:translation initiation factor IF-2-like [Falco peregrinus]